MYCKIVWISFNSKLTILAQTRDDNGTGFFRYSSYPAPNRTGFNFNKRVWDFFFKNLGRVWVLPRPTPIIYKFNLIQILKLI